MRRKVVFDTALTLDPENLIALRYLGDIARGLGDPSSAKMWYQRVLDADPRNDEIAALLTELANAPAMPPTEWPLTGPTGTAVMASVSLEGLTGSAPPETETAPPSAGTPAAEPAEQPEPAEPAMSEAVAGAEPAPVAAVPESAPPLASRESVAAADLAEPPEASAPPAEELLDLDELTIGATEPPVPEADRPRPSLATTGFDVERADDGLLMPIVDAANESMPAEALEPEPAPEAGAEAFPLDDLDLAPAEPTPSTPIPAMDPFATETMAELYRSQGHRDAALRVYRQLRAQRPGDAGIQARIAELEAAVDTAPPASQPAQEVPDLDASSFTFDANVDAVEAEATEDEGLVIEPPAGLLTGDLSGVGPPEDASAPAEEAPSEAPVHSERPVAAGPVDDAARRRGPGPSIREFLTALGSHVLGEGGRDLGPEETDDRGSTPMGGMTSVEVQEFVAEATVAAVDVEPVERQGSSESWLEGVDVVDAQASAEPESRSEAPVPGAPEADSGGGSIDLMFDAAGVTQEDQAAAEGLAGAYGASAEAHQTPASPMDGAPARRATEELSLDSVFRDQRSSAAPPESRGFSFDKFFANPTPAMGSSAMETPPLGQPSESADDDIEQFNSWLDGLKKR